MEKDGEENRDKEEDGEEGEEMDRGEEGGLNHPPLRHKAQSTNHLLVPQDNCLQGQGRSRVDTLAVLCWNGLLILNILLLMRMR